MRLVNQTEKRAKNKKFMLQNVTNVAMTNDILSQKRKSYTIFSSKAKELLRHMSVLKLINRKQKSSPSEPVVYAYLVFYLRFLKITVKFFKTDSQGIQR